MIDKMDKMEEIRAKGLSTNTFFEEVYENGLEELLTLEEEKVLLNFYFCKSSLIQLYNDFANENSYEVLEFVPDIKDIFKPIFNDNNLNNQLFSKLINYNQNDYTHYYIDGYGDMVFLKYEEAIEFAISELLDNMDFVNDIVREYFTE